MPPEMAFGTITGKYFVTLLDDADPDRDPEFLAATDYTISITPTVQSYKDLSIPATFLTVAYTGGFATDGTVVDHNQQPGIKVMSSVSPNYSPSGWGYNVQISGPGVAFPSFQITVQPNEEIDLTVVSPATTAAPVVVLMSEAARVAAEAAAVDAQYWAGVAADAAGGIAGVSTDAQNLLEVGSDNKLYVGPDPGKQPAGDYATAVQLAANALADRNRANHSGSQSADTIVDGATNKAFTAAEKTKLGTVASGATANLPDATLVNRSSHTGTQTASTISDIVEFIQDTVGAMFGGGNVNTTYNDALGTITVNFTEAAPDPEAIRDTIGAAMVGVGNITVAINDAADTITISTTATVNATDAALRARSSHTGTQTASTISDFTAAAHTVADTRDTALYQDYLTSGWGSRRATTNNQFVIFRSWRKVPSDPTMTPALLVAAPTPPMIDGDGWEAHPLAAAWGNP